MSPVAKRGLILLNNDYNGPSPLAQGRTGILSFVSLLEPRAIVLADHAIAEKLSAEIWQEPVDLLIQGVKCGDLAARMNRARISGGCGVP